MDLFGRVSEKQRGVSTCLVLLKNDGSLGSMPDARVSNIIVVRTSNSDLGPCGSATAWGAVPWHSSILCLDPILRRAKVILEMTPWSMWRGYNRNACGLYAQDDYAMRI